MGRPVDTPRCAAHDRTDHVAVVDGVVTFRCDQPGRCCDDPQPRILEKSHRLFCFSCRRYLDVPRGEA